MPIYEFNCRSCNNNHTNLQKYADPPPVCPKCESADTRRLISAANFQFKGAGFYKTDYT